MNVTRGMIALVLVLVAVGTRAADLEIAWLRDNTISTPPRSEDVDTTAVRRPLGSLWKLFVYAYAVDTELATPAYRCASSRMPGEEYCCEPTQSVERDAALLKSCGLFFEPSRLKISSTQWRQYWQERVTDDARWLTDLGNMQPDKQVSVAQILRAVDAIAPTGRAAAEKALMPISVSGAAKTTAGALGGMLRVKTFTWHDPERATKIGGAAGWLVDGTPIWFSARGSSANVLRTHAPLIAERLPALVLDQTIDTSCVMVDYFARYPIQAIDALPAKASAPAGALKGTYRITFENGNTLVFTTSRDLWLDRNSDRPLVLGRHTFNEYVARVLDREASANPMEAARALAVVIRTYTLQNASVESGCYRMFDSTKQQRVSVNDPSQKAREIALFTDGLMLDAPAVRYHSERGSDGVLGWPRAVSLAQSGKRYDEILQDAFPDSALAAVSGERACRRLAHVESWYAQAAKRWNRQLANEQGFEPLTRTPIICALDSGNPYSDQERLRIYLRDLKTRDDRITLAHEYLHLAFRFHPRGEDETFIENTARRLVD